VNGFPCVQSTASKHSWREGKQVVKVVW